MRCELFNEARGKVSCTLPNFRLGHRGRHYSALLLSAISAARRTQISGTHPSLSGRLAAVVTGVMYDKAIKFSSLLR